MVMQKLSLLLLGLLLAGCAKLPQKSSRGVEKGDEAFTLCAGEYLAGYLAWRPQNGTSLGLHEYDGKVTDFSAASLAAELARLKSFDQRLTDLHTLDL